MRLVIVLRHITNSYDLKMSMILYDLRMFINSYSCSFSWNVASLCKTINLMLLIIRSFDRAINLEAWKTSHLSTFYYEVIKQQIKHRMRTWIRIGFIIREFCVALEMQSDKDAIKIKFPSSPSFGAALDGNNLNFNYHYHIFSSLIFIRLRNF